MEIDQALVQRWKNSQNEPSLCERYKQRLLETFPGEIPSGELFYPDTFDGSDAIDYQNFINLFKNKKWFEVNFDALYEIYTQHLWLTNLGKIYYLPAFLLYFYDLRHLELEYYLYFMYDLSEGIKTPKPRALNAEIEYNYTAFEHLTKAQSKLVALFLVNAQNLYPSDYFESSRARIALTNYWGKFLLID